MATIISRRILMLAFALIFCLSINAGTAHAFLSIDQYYSLRDQSRLGSGTVNTSPTPTPAPSVPGEDQNSPDENRETPDTNDNNTQPAAPGDSSVTTPSTGQTGTNTNSRTDYYSRFTDSRSNYYNNYPSYPSYPGYGNPGTTVPDPGNTTPPGDSNTTPGSGGGTTPTPDPNPSTGSGSANVDSAGEQQMLDLVNQERAKAGLPAFKVDSRLVTLARQKSQDMYENNYFSHTSPTYGSAYDMEKSAGISARVMGAENIAKSATVSRAHQLFMNSEGHRANILDPRHDTIGIGIVTTPGGVSVTQLFLGN